MITVAKSIIVGVGAILGLLTVVTIINVTAMIKCNDFLTNTYRVGHYEYFSGKCFIKTNSGKLILKEDINKKIVSVY